MSGQPSLSPSILYIQVINQSKAPSKVKVRSWASVSLTYFNQRAASTRISRCVWNIEFLFEEINNMLVPSRFAPRVNRA